MAVQHLQTDLAWAPEQLLQRPLFAPLHPALRHLVGEPFPDLETWNRLLDEHFPGIRVHSGHPLRFVAQGAGKLAFESQYEPRCYLSGEVQTREQNWHDLFNALVWLIFPRAKAAINTRHYQALQSAHDGHSQRGKVRDMATLLDESGVIVVSAEKSLSELLRNFQWKALFWQHRQQVKEAMGFYVFGHGLYEKALQPYVGMTAQGLLLDVEQEFFSWPLPERLAHVDQRVAEYLADPMHCRSTRELQPVPLLGVPGWSEENEQESYYDNANYFRAGRMQKPSGL
jgi:hypothetical protein